MKRINNLIPLALLLVSTTAASGYAISDGLVSYWPLDVDDSGTTPDMAFGTTR